MSEITSATEYDEGQTRHTERGPLNGHEADPPPIARVPHSSRH
jgi:hypothetical protein